MSSQQLSGKLLLVADGFSFNQFTFPLTRDAALQRLQAFVPDAGASYARLRNLDYGPNGHVHVSRLSAALRRRLIAEDEVVAAVLALHGPIEAEKFISEVFWRTYWKGWLEQRPTVWTGYLQTLDRARQQLDVNAAIAHRHAEACACRSEIDCSMPGPLNCRPPAISIIGRGCNSLRSGSLRLACRGNLEQPSCSTI